MKKAAAAKRGTKRVATVDKDKSNQPAKKIAKGAPEISNDDNHAVLAALTARELRQDLKSRGLRTSGTKDDLIQRLLPHLTSNSEKEPEIGPSNEDVKQTEPNPPLPLRAQSPINNINDDWDRDRSNIVKSGEIDINPYHRDVIELQQKVAELENQLQLANQAVQEADLARQYAENHIDNKPIVIQNEWHQQRIHQLENSLADLRTQLEEANRKLDEAENINKELKEDNASLKKGFWSVPNSGLDGDPVADFQKKLDVAKKREERAYANNRELNREKGELSNRVADCQRKIDSLNMRNRQHQESVELLTRQLEEMHDDARNDHVPRRNIKSEDQKPPRMQLQKGEFIVADDNSSVLEEQSNDLQMRLLSTQLEEARRKEEDTMSKIEELVKENSSLKKDLDEMGRNMQDVTTEKDQLSCEAAALKSELYASARQLQDNLEAAAEVVIEKAALKRQLDESRSKEKNATNEKVQLALDNAYLEEQLKGLKTIEKIRNDLGAENFALKGRLIELGRKLQDMTIKKDGSEIISLKKQLEHMRKEVEQSKINAVGLVEQNFKLMQQVVASRKIVIDANNEKGDLAEEKDNFKEELDEEMQDKSTEKDEDVEISFRKELDEIRREARDIDIEDERIGIMAANKQLQKRVNYLTHHLYNAQQCRNADRARIDNLMHRLAQYEGWQQQPHRMQQLQQNPHGFPPY